MPNKKITEFNVNSAPTGADVFPIVNNGETKQMSLSGLTNFVDSPEKVYFYTIQYNRKTSVLPISEPINSEFAKSTAPFLFECFDKNHSSLDGTKNFNFYSNMLFEIKEENGIDVDGLQFSGLTGLSAYLSANLTATSADTVANRFTVRMYGLKKKEYQKFSKIRGYNTFFSILRGKNSYWRQSVRVSSDDQCMPLNNLLTASISPSYINPPILKPLITEVYRHFLNFDLASNGLDIDDDAVFDDLKSTIWFNQKPKQFYNLQPINEIVNPSASIVFAMNSKGRKMFNPDTITFDSILSAPKILVSSAIYLLDKGGKTFIHTLSDHYNSGFVNSTGGTMEIESNFPFISNMGVEAGEVINNVSAIRIYMLKDISNNISFLVKPMGIDTIITDFIEDNATASLYGLFNSNSNGKQILVKFDETTKSNYRTGNVSWRIQLDDYELFTLDKVPVKANLVPTNYIKHVSRYEKNTFKSFRLFYGYPDGTISPLSDDEIYHIVKANGCPLKRMIRKNTIN